MEPQKYKNETQKVVDFRGKYLCISFLYVPRYGLERINENNAARRPSGLVGKLHIC